LIVPSDAPISVQTALRDLNDRLISNERTTDRLARGVSRDELVSAMNQLRHEISAAVRRSSSLDAH